MIIECNGGLVHVTAHKYVRQNQHKRRHVLVEEEKTPAALIQKPQSTWQSIWIRMSHYLKSYTKNKLHKVSLPTYNLSYIHATIHA